MGVFKWAGVDYRGKPGRARRATIYFVRDGDASWWPGGREWGRRGQPLTNVGYLQGKVWKRHPCHVQANEQEELQGPKEPKTVSSRGSWEGVEAAR